MIKEPKEPKQRKGKRRKLTIQDIQAIADLVATMKLTESEACLHLDIPPHQWQCWKSRGKHSANFETIIARTRANNIAGLISKIREAGDDYEIQLPNGKVVKKRGDWRALDSILTKVEPRFSPQPANAPPATVSIQIGLIHDQLKRVIGFANEALQPSLLTNSVEIADSASEPLKSNLNKLKMPVRRKRE